MVIGRVPESKPLNDGHFLRIGLRKSYISWVPHMLYTSAHLGAPTFVSSNTNTKEK